MADSMASARGRSISMQVACGLSHTVVCTDDGKVWTFGQGRYGQLGLLNQTDNQDRPKLISEADNNLQERNGQRMSDKPVVQVSAGAYHSAAVRVDGLLYTWGHDANGRLGHGPPEERNNKGQSFVYAHRCTEPNLQRPHSLSHIFTHTNNTHTHTPLPPPPLFPPSSLPHPHFSLFAPPDDKRRSTTSPMLVYALQNFPVIQVSCGSDFTLAVDNSGAVFSWGMGNYGNLGHGDTNDYDRPKLVHRLKSEVIRSAAAGAKHSVCVSQSGDIWSFGHGDNGRLGNGATQGSLVPERTEGRVRGSNVVFVAAGEAHSACIDDRGRLYTWGMGSYGRLGSGGEADLAIPSLVESVAKVKMVMVSCGAFHTSSLSLEGNIYAFGGGLYGKLGNGSEDNAPIPLKLPEGKAQTLGFGGGSGGDVGGFGSGETSVGGYNQIACGTFHTVAANEQGSLMAWGFGGAGRLGLGSQSKHLRPTLVDGLEPHLCSGWSSKRFADKVLNGDGDGAGGSSGQGSMAAMSAGGRGGDSKGDGMDEEEPPTKIVGVAAGAKHSLYCTAQGHVYSWGSNEDGQCGVSRDTDVPLFSPEQVKAHIGGLRVVKVACGARHSLCVTARGDMYTWGAGGAGQLGHGSPQVRGETHAQHCDSRPTSPPCS